MTEAALVMDVRTLNLFRTTNELGIIRLDNVSETPLFPRILGRIQLNRKVLEHT